MPAASAPPGGNAAAWFAHRHVAEGRADATCFRFGGHDVPYGGVSRAVHRMAGALDAAGVAPGERVILLLPDSPAFAHAFWGAMQMGAIPVPINPLLTPADIAALLADSGAAAVIVAAAFAPAVREALRWMAHDATLADAGAVQGEATPPRLAAPIVIVDGVAERDELSLESLLRGRADEAPVAPADPLDAAFWLYTSGTTGASKGVIHRHRDLRACCGAFGRHVLGIGPDDRVFSVAKMFFAYGLGNSLYYPMGVGASSILHPARFDPLEILGVIARERPTLVFAVPTAYAAMLHAPDATSFDTASVRAWCSAGEPLPPALLDRWRAAFGADILDGLGSTEMCNTFIASRPGRVRPGATGELVPGYEARIVDERGGDLGADVEGDLLVRGDSAFDRYWERPERTAQVKRDGWVRTGDRYRRDADGYFWYAGRSDDMIKAGGMWVAPAEVEAALAEHDAVRECGVVGVDDENGLAKPGAVVVLRDRALASQTLADELKRFVKSRLAPWKYPRWIVFADALPRTATGKLRRFLLRDMIAAGERR